MKCLWLAVLMVISTINAWPTEEDLEVPVEVIRPTNGGLIRTGQSDLYGDLEYNVGAEYLDDSQLYAQKPVELDRRQHSVNPGNNGFASRSRGLNAQQAYKPRQTDNEEFGRIHSFNKDQIQVPSGGFRRKDKLEQDARSDHRSYLENQSGSPRVHGPSSASSEGREHYGQLRSEDQFLQHGVGSALRDSAIKSTVDVAHPRTHSSEDAVRINQQGFVHSDVINGGYQVPNYIENKRVRPIEYYNQNPNGPASVYQRPKTFSDPLLRGSVKQNFANEFLDNEPENYVRKTKRFTASHTNSGPSQPRITVYRNIGDFSKEDSIVASKNDQAREFERDTKEYINKALKEADEAEKYALDFASKLSAITNYIGKDLHKVNVVDFADNSQDFANPSDIGDQVKETGNHNEAPVFQRPYYLPHGKFVNNPRYKDFYPSVVTKPNYGPFLDYPVHVRKGYIPHRIPGTVNVVENSDNSQNLNKPISKDEDKVKVVESADNSQNNPIVNDKHADRVKVVENAVNNNQDEVKVVEVAYDSGNHDDGEKVKFVNNAGEVSSNGNNGVNVVDSTAGNPSIEGIWNQGLDNSHLLRYSHQSSGPVFQTPTYYLPSGKFTNNPRYKNIFPGVITKPNYGPFLDYPVHLRKGYIPHRIGGTVNVVENADNSQNLNTPINKDNDKVKVVETADDSSNIPNANDKNTDKVKVVENAVNNNQDKVKVVELANGPLNEDGGEKVKFVNNYGNNGVNVVESPANNPSIPGIWNYGNDNSHLLRYTNQNKEPVFKRPYYLPHGKFVNNPRYKDLYPSIVKPNYGPFQDKVNVVETAGNTNDQDKVKVVDLANNSENQDDGKKVEFVNNNDDTNAGNNENNVVDSSNDNPNTQVIWNHGLDNSHLLRNDKPVNEPVNNKLPTSNNGDSISDFKRPSYYFPHGKLNNPNYKDVNPNVAAKPKVNYPVHGRGLPQIDNTETDIGAPGFMTSPSNLNEDSEYPDTAQNAYKSRPSYNGFRPDGTNTKKDFKNAPEISISYYRNPPNFLPNEAVNGPTTIVGGPVIGFQTPDISPVFANVVVLPDGTYIPGVGNNSDLSIDKTASESEGIVKPVEEKLPQVILPSVVNENDLEKKVPSISLESIKLTSVSEDGKRDQNSATITTPTEVAPQNKGAVSNEVSNIVGPTTVPEDSPSVTGFQVPDISPTFIEVIVQPDGTLIPSKEKNRALTNNNEAPADIGSLEYMIKQQFDNRREQPTTNENLSENKIIPSTQKNIEENKEKGSSTNGLTSKSANEAPNEIEQRIASQSSSASSSPSNNKPASFVPVETKTINEKTVEPKNDAILTEKDPSKNLNKSLDITEKPNKEKDTEGNTKRKHKSHKHNKKRKNTPDEDGLNEDEKKEIKNDTKTSKNIKTSDVDEDGDRKGSKTDRVKHKKNKRKHTKRDKQTKNTDELDTVSRIEATKSSTETAKTKNDETSKANDNKVTKDIKASEDQKAVSKESDISEKDKKSVQDKEHKSKHSIAHHDGKNKKKHSKRNKGKKIESRINSDNEDNPSKTTEVTEKTNKIDDKSDTSERNIEAKENKSITEENELLNGEGIKKDIESSAVKNPSKDNVVKKKHGKRSKGEKSNTNETTKRRRRRKNKKSRKHNNDKNIDVTDNKDQKKTKAIINDKESASNQQDETIKKEDDAVANSYVNDNDPKQDSTIDVKDKTEKDIDTTQNSSVTPSDDRAINKNQESVNKDIAKKKPRDVNEETKGDETEVKRDRSNTGNSEDLKDNDEDTKTDSTKGNNENAEDISQAPIIRKSTRYYKLRLPKRRKVSKNQATNEKEKSAEVSKNSESTGKSNEGESVSKLATDSDIDSTDQTESGDKNASKTKPKKLHLRLTVKHHKGKKRNIEKDSDTKSKKDSKEDNKSNTDVEESKKTESKKAETTKHSNGKNKHSKHEFNKKKSENTEQKDNKDTTSVSENSESDAKEETKKSSNTRKFKHSKEPEHSKTKKVKKSSEKSETSEISSKSESVENSNEDENKSE